MYQSMSFNNAFNYIAVNALDMCQTMPFSDAFNYSAYALHSFCIINMFELHHENFELHHENFELHHENYVTAKNVVVADSTDFYFLPIYIPPVFTLSPVRNGVIKIHTTYIIYGNRKTVESIVSLSPGGILSIVKTIEMHAEDPLYNVVLMQVKVVLMQVKVVLMQVKVDNVANKVVMNVDNCKAP